MKKKVKVVNYCSGRRSAIFFSSILENTSQEISRVPKLLGVTWKQFLSFPKMFKHFALFEKPLNVNGSM
jgi:hypothetical protein